MKKKLPYIHPLLFALYPVIFLYSQNIHEYPENTIVVPLILSLGVALAVFFVTKLFLKTIDKTAIVSSLFLILFFSYGRLVQATGNAFLVVVSMLVALAISVFIIRRYKKSLLLGNKLCVVISLLLLLFPLINIVQFETKTGRVFTHTQNKPVQKAQEVTPAKDSPDIYYFIFDRYVGPGAEKSQYNFDNSAFLDSLKEKGFYVAKDATTNYPKTFLSLGSSLNMEYLDDLTAKTNGGASSDQSIVTPLIRNNKILQFLKSKGYTVVNIGPKTWGPTSSNPYADVNFEIKKGTYPLVDTFTTGFLNTTIAAPLLSQLFHDPIDVSQDPNNNEHRKVILFELTAVEKAIAIPGPKFVFAHILFPHDPFVFDKNCNPISEKEVEKHDHVYNYLNQLICANKKISQLISDILAKSKTPPIIILQSDEGPFPMNEPIPPKQGWGSAKDQSLQEKFPILNAYYFPGKEQTQLYPSITPVNSFRVLFNTYFGTQYDLLPDKNYVFQDEENYYKFTDVTSRVKGTQ